MIHPTAIIHKKAQVDPSAEIGPYTVIDEHVKIGPGCKIGPHVHLTGWLSMGEGNRVHAGAVLGDLPQDLAYEPCESSLSIGKNNIIREMVTMHRGTKPNSETVIGDQNYFMATSHVAHNCRIGNHVILSNCSLAAGYVELQDYCIVSGGVVLHQFIRVGKMAILRGQSRYSKDIPPYCVGDGTNGIVGLNVVGLRRAGLGPDARKQLKRAFHAAFLSDKPPLKAIEGFDGETTKEVKELFEFIRSAKRGVCFVKGKEEESEEEEV
jgi:UDP-N-acetylglucosamine acyltransferase